jgi:hypothetical protein
MLEAIVQYIKNNINSLIIGENLFANHYPDSLDRIVSVIDAGGSPPPRYSPTGEKRFEIKFRVSNYSDGVDIGNQIMDLFQNKENYQLGSFFILDSHALTDVTYLYADKNNRDEFTFNLSFLIKK